MEPVKVNYADSLDSAQDHNPEKSVSVSQFFRGNYETVQIVAILVHITEVPYELREF